MKDSEEKRGKKVMYCEEERFERPQYNGPPEEIGAGETLAMFLMLALLLGLAFIL